MINCDHPSHFENVLDEGEPWKERIKGLQAKTSAKSHAGLDEAVEVDDGDPLELGRQYRDLKRKITEIECPRWLMWYESPPYQ